MRPVRNDGQRSANTALNPPANRLAQSRMTISKLLRPDSVLRIKQRAAALSRVNLKKGKGLPGYLTVPSPDTRESGRLATTAHVSPWVSSGGSSYPSGGYTAQPSPVSSGLPSTLCDALPDLPLLASRARPPEFLQHDHQGTSAYQSAAANSAPVQAKDSAFSASLRKLIIQRQQHLQDLHASIQGLASTASSIAQLLAAQADGDAYPVNAGLPLWFDPSLRDALDRLSQVLLASRAPTTPQMLQHDDSPQPLPSHSGPRQSALVNSAPASQAAAQAMGSASLHAMILERQKQLSDLVLGQAQARGMQLLSSTYELYGAQGGAHRASNLRHTPASIPLHHALRTSIVPT
jgi:hypothetical protein